MEEICIDINVEIKKESDGTYTVYIGEENGSGAIYHAETFAEVADKIQYYLDLYVKDRV